MGIRLESEIRWEDAHRLAAAEFLSDPAPSGAAVSVGALLEPDRACLLLRGLHRLRGHHSFHYIRGDRESDRDAHRTRFHRISICGDV